VVEVELLFLEQQALELVALVAVEMLVLLMVIMPVQTELLTQAGVAVVRLI
jgi:hypothetical protein